MIICKKCKGKIFVDRCHSASDHLELFCILCGDRRMYHPPSNFKEIKWLEIAEKNLLKSYNGK